MAGLIPDNILEDILSRVDIVELIQGYIPLKRAGRNFKSTCPFHHEKTPSFMISPDRQIYHCFGCGESGNAFKFLIRHERMEFREAVEFLAKKAGVQIPEARPQDQEAKNLYLELYRVNELAATFYQNILYSPEASAVRDYLHKRGINDESIKLFKLGYAPDKWDALIIFLRAKGINLSLLEKAGLIIPRSSGGYHDRFRHRIIFPIFDIKSRVLGFGARVLDNSLPKYVNSPETPVYTKGKNLYGLNLAKDAIRDNDAVAIVEGYLDYIIPYQHGLRNIVASLGTALTCEQVRALKRYTHNAVIIFDPDRAGELATLRSLDIFIEEAMEVKVVSLPQGFDPDLFVRKNGIEALKAGVNTAETIFDYKLKVLKARHGYRNIESKAKVAADMLVTVNKFTNAVLKSEYIKKLAGELDLEEAALLEELKKIKPDKTYGATPSAPPRSIININPTEKLLIKLMLEEQGVINRIREHLEPADFRDERISRLVALLFDFVQQGRHVDTSVIVNHFDDDTILQVIGETTFSPEVSLENRDKIVDNCINRLKQEKLKSKKHDLYNQIKLAQHLGDEDKLQSLMREFQHLVKTNFK